MSLVETVYLSHPRATRTVLHGPADHVGLNEWRMRNGHAAQIMGPLAFAGSEIPPRSDRPDRARAFANEMMTSRLRRALRTC